MRRQKAKLTDVAARAGVHASTVSRALNPETRHLVSDDVATKIAQAAADLGYAPNLVAASLRKGRTGIVGVIISDIVDPVYPPIVRAIEDTLEKTGHAALVGNSDSSPERDAALLERLLARGVDGIISATLRIRDPHVAKVREAGVPLVAVLRDPGDPTVSTVASDDYQGVRAVVAHLVELGHRRIGHIAGPQDVSTGVSRLRAFRDAMAAAGLSPDPAAVAFAARYRIGDGEAAASRLFEQTGKEPPTAVVCANDLIAMGCYRELRRRGLNCPGDVSVTGLNDMPLAALVDPPLSTVRTPTYRMGAEAAALLLRQIAGDADEPTRLLIVPELIIRESTAVPPRRRVMRANRTPEDAAPERA